MSTIDPTNPLSSASIPPSSSSSSTQGAAVSGAMLTKMVDEMQAIQAAFKQTSSPAATSATTTQTRAQARTQVSQMLSEINSILATSNTQLSAAMTQKQKIAQLQSQFAAMQAAGIPEADQGVFNELKSLILGKAMQGVINSVAIAEQALLFDKRCLSNYLKKLVVSLPNAPTQMQWPGRTSQFAQNEVNWESLVQDLLQLKMDMNMNVNLNNAMPFNSHVKVIDPFDSDKLVSVSQLTAVNRAHKLSLLHQYSITAIQNILNGANVFKGRKFVSEGQTLQSAEFDVPGAGGNARAVASWIMAHKTSLMNNYPDAAVNKYDVPHMSTQKLPGAYTSNQAVGGGFSYDKVYVGYWKLATGTWQQIFGNVFQKRQAVLNNYKQAQVQAQQFKNMISRMKQGQKNLQVQVSNTKMGWLHRQLSVLNKMYQAAKADNNASVLGMAKAMLSHLHQLSAKMASLANVSVEWRVLQPNPNAKPSSAFRIGVQILYKGKTINNSALLKKIQSFNSALNNFEGAVKANAATISAVTNEGQDVLQECLGFVQEYYGIAATLLNLIGSLMSHATQHLKGEGG